MSTDKILYDNGMGEKIEKAIEAGLIVRRIDNDGVPVYSLTRQGLIQWQMENLRDAGLFR